MKFFVIFALVATAIARCAAVPQAPSSDALITRYDSDNIGVDGYNYAFETSNGIAASEQGVLNNAESENEALNVQGQFSYTGPDGVVYTVTYVADENGFQPSGEHLPTPPPL